MPYKINHLRLTNEIENRAQNIKTKAQQIFHSMLVAWLVGWLADVFFFSSNYATPNSKAIKLAFEPWHRKIHSTKVNWRRWCSRTHIHRKLHNANWLKHQSNEQTENGEQAKENSRSKRRKKKRKNEKRMLNGFNNCIKIHYKIAFVTSNLHFPISLFGSHAFRLDNNPNVEYILLSFFIICGSVNE